MPVALKLSNTQSTVALEGGIDIGSAAELKTALIEALAAGQPVLVELGQITDLDITAVQLLWAAKREAGAAGVEFAWDGQEPVEVRAALLEAGLDLNAAFGNMGQASL